MTLTLVADDLTGACDTGALFTGDGPVPLSFWPSAPAAGAVRVVDTESRALGEDEARARLSRATGVAQASRYFKKIDSTLRGHVAVEVGALMNATGITTALVCPAFPAQGRTVIDRVLRVDGIPVADTPAARSPEFPALGSSSVVDLLRPRGGRPLAWIPLDHVRAGVPGLAARIGRLEGMVIVADAETDADLEALVDGADASGIDPLLVGAAGLGRALADRLSLLPPALDVPVERRWLLVAGSRHPVTRAQARAARAAGLPVLSAPEEPAGDHRQVARRLAADACARLAREPFDGIAATGGDTALALCQALGATGLELIGPPRPGLALARVTGTRHPDLLLLTKAGGFGEPDLFASVLSPALARGRAS
jgi:uncharacterized protein YgbK (DUF1537 family)